jgi:hypothetical protein
LDGIKFYETTIDKDDEDFIGDGSEDDDDDSIDKESCPMHNITQYKFSEVKGKVNQIKVTLQRLKKVTNSDECLGSLIKAALNHCAVESKDHTNFKDLFQMWREITAYFHMHEDADDSIIGDFGYLCDKFGRLFITMFGASRLTMYMHLLISGVLTEKLKQFKSFVSYSNQSVEMYMGSTRCYIHTRTQGFGGGKDGKQEATRRTLEALSFRSLRQMGNMKAAMGGDMSKIIEKKNNLHFSETVKRRVINEGSNIKDVARKKQKELLHRESKATADGTNPAGFRKYNKKFVDINCADDM